MKIAISEYSKSDDLERLSTLAQTFCFLSKIPVFQRRIPPLEIRTLIRVKSFHKKSEPHTKTENGQVFYLPKSLFGFAYLRGNDTF